MWALSGAVTVQPFSLDATEVTVDAYAACVQSGQCTADHLGETTMNGIAFFASPLCNYGVSGRGNHPVNCVDWGQAATYCHAQGKRLPTQEEWEWAARGGAEGRTYPWGNAAPDFQPCWSGITKRASTCPVGSNSSGDAPGGIHDLAGNVWEWTSSNMGPDNRVIRGGAWTNTDAQGLTVANTNGAHPPWHTEALGMRCAR